VEETATKFACVIYFTDVQMHYRIARKWKRLLGLCWAKRTFPRTTSTSGTLCG
jgi:hypothetical protein